MNYENYIYIIMNYENDLKVYSDNYKKSDIASVKLEKQKWRIRCTV